MNRTVTKKLKNSKLNFLQSSSNVIIENLIIGVGSRSYNYTAPVRGYNGNISGGGTKTSSYNLVDFGISVKNISDSNVTIQFNLEKVDADGYVVDKIETRNTIEPNEKQRLWAGLNLNNGKKLNSYNLKKIIVVSNDEEITNVDKNIGELFGYKPNPYMKLIWILSFLLIITVLYLLLIFLKS